MFILGCEVRIMSFLENCCFGVDRLLDFSGKVVVLMDNVLLSGTVSSFYNSGARVSKEVISILNSVGEKNIYCIILADKC